MNKDFSSEPIKKKGKKKNMKGVHWVLGKENRTSHTFDLNNCYSLNPNYYLYKLLQDLHVRSLLANESFNFKNNIFIYFFYDDLKVNK